MNSRIKMFLICFVCLCFGSVIYLFSRPDAYISIFIFKLFCVEKAHIIIPPIISHYLPDYLWASALCSCLFAIWPLKEKKGLIWGTITFLYGALWETLQLFSIVSGTADIIDVILYLAAALVVVMINFNFKKRRKK